MEHTHLAFASTGNEVDGMLTVEAVYCIRHINRIAPYSIVRAGGDVDGGNFATVQCVILIRAVEHHVDSHCLGRDRLLKHIELSAIALGGATGGGVGVCLVA